MYSYRLHFLPERTSQRELCRHEMFSASGSFGNGIRMMTIFGFQIRNFFKKD